MMALELVAIGAFFALASALLALAFATGALGRLLERCRRWRPSS
jgi:hypothetical protein